MNREDCVAYAKRHDIPVAATKEKIYSIDENLWGRAIECGEMEDPWAPPPDDAYVLTRPTATEATEIVIGFEGGTPVSIDGKELALDVLINEVATLVGSFGWGRLDMVENRRVGIKSRETYECPAALALLLAHRDLEDLTLERDVAHEKLRLEPRWAELVYDGMWFSPLKDALDAFFESTQRHVTGEVRLALSPGAVSASGSQLPGSCVVNGRRSPVSLYKYDLATYDSGDRFRHEDAEGFVRLWGLGVATWAERQGQPGAQGSGGGASSAARSHP
jgi:argininosuccinate synthase